MAIPAYDPPVKPLVSDVTRLAAEAVAVRRALHARPELAFEEVETARLVADPGLEDRALGPAARPVALFPAAALEARERLQRAAGPLADGRKQPPRLLEGEDPLRRAHGRILSWRFLPMIRP